MTVTSAGATVTNTVTAGGSTVTSTTTRTVTSGGSSGGLSGTINIGVMTDLSDGLTSEGLRVQAATQLAAQDINAWLQNTTWAGKVQFNVVVEDYALDNTKALNDLNSFQSQGISVVVGPLNSGSTGAILSQADSDQIVLISPSSTSPALSIPNDYLFRTAPNDVNQGAADARMMYQQGAQAIIIVYRDDTYGSGLANYTSARFTALGGTVADLIPYDPSTTNFLPVLQQLNTDYQSAVAQYGANSVAIQAISFEELGPMLLQAQSNYPSLLSTPQPWYGSDGEAGDSVLTNSTYATVMTQVRMPSTVFGYTNSSKTATICAEMAAKGPNLSCDSYGLSSYDDVWLAALSILDCGVNTGSCIQKVLPSVADSYFGVTGWTQLQPSGDRAYGDFQIWCVEPAGSSGSAWVLCGTWSQLSDTVTWINQP